MNPNVPLEWWRPDLAIDRNGQPEAAALARSRSPGSAAPFWALIGFTFVLLLAPAAHFSFLAPLRLALLTAGLATATYLFDRISRRQAITILPREMWLAACLASWAVLCVPLSYWPGGSVSFLLDVYFKSLLIFWLLSNVVNSAQRIRRVFWALSLMAVPLAMTGVRNFFGGVFLADADRIVGYEAPLTGNPNDLALMLNMILPLTVALCLIQRKSVVRASLLAIIGLAVVAVILTFSRSGFLTLATIFVMYLWKFRSRPERRWLWTGLAVISLCVPLLVPAYLDRLATIADIETDPTGSAQGRWSDTVTATKIVLRNPIIGAGVGQNILALNEERGPLWKAIHNVYLEYAVELGIPALALFVLLLVGCVRSVAFVQRQSHRVPGGRELFYLAEAIQVSLVAFALAAIFYPVAYQFYFYYMAGLAVAAKAVFESERRRCSRTE